MSQPPLAPGWISPYAWVLQTFPQERRALAAAVFRVQWSQIRKEGGTSRQGLLSAAHRYVGQAERNPDSVRWAENAAGRRHAEKGDRWKKDLERLAEKLWE